MKNIFIALLLPCLLILGCGEGPVIKKVGEVNLIEVKVGAEFIIPVYANPSTGYAWQLAKPLDEQFLQLVGNEYLTEDTTLIGAGCEQEWTFKALKPGKALISLQYLRNWEKGVAPVKIEEFQVSIK